MCNSVLIKNGTIANAEAVFAGDILIENGKISQIGTDLEATGVETYDATGMLVMPGIIDPHVQLEIKYGKFPMTDDFDTGTIAAAAGGVTTMIDFADQPKGVAAIDDLIHRKSLADGRVNVDYSLHMSLTDTKAGAVGDIKAVVESGIASFKLYMAYSRRDRMVNEGQIDHIMSEAAKYGAITGIHGENDNMVEYLIARYQQEGKTGIQYFTQARPDTAEIIAVQTAITLAERNHCTLYVHHVSCAGTLNAIKEGRKRGVKIYAETCPAYLTLTEDVYQKEGGEIFILNPALRKESDRLALWQGIIDGEIDTIGTDHCSYTLEQKRTNKDNFDGIPAGLPGIELLFPVMYTIAVAENKVTLPRLLELMTYNPARIFGLAPQKGILAPGSDGDILIYDPNKTWQVDPANLFMNVDFTPFDGWTMQGEVKATFLRGEKLYENHVFCGPHHHGQFVFGTPAPYRR